MSYRKHQQTLHHVVPSSRRDEGFDTAVPPNFKMLRKTYHQNWHALFANKTPQEVIRATIMVQHNVINRKVRNLIEALTRLPKKNFYIPDVLDYYADEELSEREINAARQEVRDRIEDLLADIDTTQTELDFSGEGE